jgi:RNA polymerase sigma factor (sigma-70 family)
MPVKVDSAFMQLINENIGIARKVSRAYGFDSEGTEDLFQEMMYQLWKSFPSFARKSKFSTWMYSVCLNTAFTYRRKEGGGRNTISLQEHHDVPEVREGNDRVEELYSAITALDPVNRAIVLLYLDDLSYEEIAAVTGLSRSNVSVRLVRIKKELEGKMSKTKY